MRGMRPCHSAISEALKYCASCGLSSVGGGLKGQSWFVWVEMGFVGLLLQYKTVRLLIFL